MNKTNQQLWDQTLVNAFYLKINALTMNDVIETFSNQINLEKTQLSSLSLLRYPMNESAHLSSSPIHFVCAFVPELAKLLWENSDSNIENTLLKVANIKNDTQKEAANSKYENLKTSHRKRVKTEIGRRSMALSRQLDQKVVLDWNSPKIK